MSLSPFLSPLPGDVDRSGIVTLADAILLLQVLSHSPLTPAASVHPEADVDGDGRIGAAEILYLLQKTAGMR